MGDYIDVAGHPTWVEQTAGASPDTETVLLLHGGLSSSDLLLGVLGAALAPEHHVVAFDRRGHGRTADTTEAFHYDGMADETIAVLEQVVGGPAHLVGYSDGGIVALLVAIRRPDLVRRLVVIGTNFHHDGLHDLDFDPESPVAAMIADDFGTKSPDGVEHFTVVLDKTITMFATEPTMRASDLASIATPTLVMAGDDDLVKLTHTCGLYEALPESQLAIVPGTSHFLVLEKPELATQMILDFLHSPSPPPTLTPHRRAEQPPLETSTA